MFAEVIDSAGSKFSLHITIKCDGSKKFRVWAEEEGKPNSKYADREIIVDGERTIYFSFPISPETLFIGVGNVHSPSDKSFTVTLERKPLTTYEIWLKNDTSKFVALASKFSMICGYSAASPNGRIFSYKDKQFIIKYFDVIRDFKTGKTFNTPARIGHTTGNIEVAKVKFDRYTVAMRMMILLHEYSHVFMNPQIGVKVENEIGADINALYIYLGLGFSKIDALCVYANVFLKAQTASNIDRMRRIQNYIEQFENEKYVRKLT